MRLQMWTTMELGDPSPSLEVVTPAAGRQGQLATASWSHTHTLQSFASCCMTLSKSGAGGFRLPSAKPKGSARP